MIFAQTNRLSKSLKDDNTKFTNVGNIGITITNFGTYGHGFTRWPQQPSAEYPKGSGIEHLFDGGLWIGAYKANDSLGNGRTGPYVTTGAVDAASVSARGGGGFEWTNKMESGVIERSSLLSSKFYSPLAISHQDLLSDFTDTNIVYDNGEVIVEHIPIGVVVRQESYAWNYPFADYFVIMNYWIKNVSDKYLDSVYVGLWTDAVIRNTKITPPGGSAFFNKGGNGFIPGLRMGYEFDSNGDPGFTNSYLGVQILGASEKFDSSNYVTWQFRNASDPIFFAPQNDFERYSKMQGYFGGTFRFNDGINPQSLKAPSNRSFMVSAGAFRNIPPGDSINVVFAIVCAKKFGEEPMSLDSDEQKLNLVQNADWALRAYFGEDRNRNGILDPGEDIDGNGEITRYILPGPPVSPKVKIVTESNKVTLFWDRSSENSIDPISGEADFEGYRIYKTNAGADLDLTQNLLASLVKVAEFDSSNNNLFFNTGFDYVKLDEPVKFTGDTVTYHYKFEIDNLLNGWQYLFNVTAFDRGDPVNRIESLESSQIFNIKRIIPGTPAVSDEDNIEIGVYPNPYYGEAYWDGRNERLRKLYFYNLPKECDIYIYTLAGDIVKKIEHDQTTNSSSLRWFEQYSDGTQQFAGGEAAWDLISDSDQAIASGLYLFSVKNKATGKIKTGKFLIIK
ncbi:MAG: hypothetical protein IAE91_05335 [Ignavibacteriaceae bacterium]|nr:hypothetical protein [Ignavibacteriaceae bacterium]